MQNDDEKFVGGGLTLKGASSVGPIKKKKKKKSKSTHTPTEQASSTATTNTKRTKTKAELKFKEVQEKRLKDKIEKSASKTHKERVAEFNSYLEKLSEHHDIPRVGPG